MESGVGRSQTERCTMRMRQKPTFDREVHDYIQIVVMLLLTKGRQFGIEEWGEMDPRVGRKGCYVKCISSYSALPLLLEEPVRGKGGMDWLGTVFGKIRSMH